MNSIIRASLRILASDNLAYAKKLKAFITGEPERDDSNNPFAHLSQEFTKIYGGRIEFRLFRKGAALNWNKANEGVTVGEVVKKLEQHGLQVDKTWNPKQTDQPRLYLRNFAVPLMMVGKDHQVVVIDSPNDKSIIVLVES